MQNKFEWIPQNKHSIYTCTCTHNQIYMNIHSKQAIKYNELQWIQSKKSLIWCFSISCCFLHLVDIIVTFYDGILNESGRYIGRFFCYNNIFLSFVATY